MAFCGWCSSSTARSSLKPCQMSVSCIAAMKKLPRICRIINLYPTRVGGQIRDLPDTFIPRLKKFLDEFEPSLNECDNLLTRNRIFVDRTRDIGVISKDRAIAYALSGPNLRGSGLEHDLRRKHPYLDYENYDFDVVVGSAGDCYDRYLVRIEQMRQSVLTLRQAIDKLPSGPINVTDWKNMTPPK